MMKFLYALVVVITVFLGLTFTYMNNQAVELHYFSGRAVINLPLLLLCTLVLGVFAGFLASIWSSLKVRRNLWRAKKHLKDLESGDL